MSKILYEHIDYFYMDLYSSGISWMDWQTFKSSEENVWISSRLGNLSTQTLSRKTWGEKLPCIFFLVGEGPEELQVSQNQLEIAVISSVIQVQMKFEGERHRDLLQYPGVDSYRNLTHKVETVQIKKNIPPLQLKLLAGQSSCSLLPENTDFGQCQLKGN